MEDHDRLVGLLSEFSELAIPQHCAGCGKPRTRICAGCLTELCGSPHYVRVKSVSPQEFPILAGARYEGAPRNLLLAAKERSQTSLIPVIADAAFGAAALLLESHTAPLRLVIVPVPSTAHNNRIRGYNLVAEMARHIRKRLEMNVGDVRVILALKHGRPVADQSQLTARERAANLHGALMLADSHRKSLHSSQVLILDDLVTTGATLREARRALITGGADVIGAVCAMSGR